jgi:hypothetical protein
MGRKADELRLAAGPAQGYRDLRFRSSGGFSETRICCDSKEMKGRTEEETNIFMEVHSMSGLRKISNRPLQSYKEES